MSKHYSFREKECWSCEYFMCKKEIKKGFSGISIETELRGTCSCKNCHYYGKEMRDEMRACYNYQKSSLVLAAIKEEEMMKEEKKKAAEEERIRRENMTPEERAQEAKKNKIMLLSILGIIATIITITIIVCIAKSIASSSSSKKGKKKFMNSETGLFLQKIGFSESYYMGNETAYSTTKSVKYNDSYYKLEIEYYRDSVTDIFGDKYDFRIKYSYKDSSKKYSEIRAYMMFNLEGSNNSSTGINNATFYSLTFADGGTLRTVYRGKKVNNSVITFDLCNYYYDNWNNDNNDYVEEWKDEGAVFENAIYNCVMELMN